MIVFFLFLPPLFCFILFLSFPLLHHLRELLPADPPVVVLVVFSEKELDLSLTQVAQGLTKLRPRDLSVLIFIHQFPQSLSLRDLLGQLLSFVHKSLIEGALDGVVLDRVLVQHSLLVSKFPHLLPLLLTQLHPAVREVGRQVVQAHQTVAVLVEIFKYPDESFADAVSLHLLLGRSGPESEASTDPGHDAVGEYGAGVARPSITTLCTGIDS